MKSKFPFEPKIFNPVILFLDFSITIGLFSVFLDIMIGFEILLA